MLGQLSPFPKYTVIVIIFVFVKPQKDRFVAHIFQISGQYKS